MYTFCFISFSEMLYYYLFINLHKTFIKNRYSNDIPHSIALLKFKRVFFLFAVCKCEILHYLIIFECRLQSWIYFNIIYCNALYVRVKSTFSPNWLDKSKNPPRSIPLKNANSIYFLWQFDIEVKSILFFAAICPIKIHLNMGFFSSVRWFQFKILIKLSAMKRGFFRVPQWYNQPNSF